MDLASPTSDSLLLASPAVMAPVWASANDWATFRPIITQHYRDENMKLKELIVFMDVTYGFKAT